MSRLSLLGLSLLGLSLLGLSLLGLPFLACPFLACPFLSEGTTNVSPRQLGSSPYGFFPQLPRGCLSTFSFSSSRTNRVAVLQGERCR
jgi:hypothetical protein